MSSALEQPKANAIFFPTEIADFAKDKPTCLAAHTKMIRFDSDIPIGERVFPVPVGAIYSTILGDTTDNCEFSSS